MAAWPKSPAACPLGNLGTTGAGKREKHTNQKGNMKTTTIKFLQAQVDRINRATNSPMESYTKDGSKYRANVGNYHLSGAYGGYSLHRMETDGGGVSDVFRCGHIPKRDLSNRISAFLNGLEAKS